LYRRLLEWRKPLGNREGGGIVKPGVAGRNLVDRRRYRRRRIRHSMLEERIQVVGSLI
jgi:hypothetical protein